MKWIVAIAIATAIASWRGETKAADFRVSGDKVYLIGPIVQGDLERFKVALKSAGPSTLDVALRSSGGRVDEAIAMGQLIRKLYLNTEAPGEWSGPESTRVSCASDPRGFVSREHCTCASACFLVWSGGIYRRGHGLYLHRISFEKKFYGELSPPEAAELYDRSAGIIQKYLRDMSVPDGYYERMFNTPSWRVTKLRVPELVSDFMTPAPSFDEWLIARCGGFSNSTAENDRVSKCRHREVEKERNNIFRQVFGD